MENVEMQTTNFEEIFAQAQIAAQVANITEPRAVKASYDVEAQVISIQLQSGATFTFPPGIAQGLADATPEELAEVEITPMGDALHWERLDADLSVPDLLQGRFGSEQWMANVYKRVN
jgi:hypothetical protein